MVVWGDAGVPGDARGQARVPGDTRGQIGWSSRRFWGTGWVPGGAVGQGGLYLRGWRQVGFTKVGTCGWGCGGSRSGQSWGNPQARSSNLAWGASLAAVFILLW